MSPGSAPWPSRVPRTAFSCCLQSIQKLWRTLCRNPGLLFMKKHVRPGAVPCVKRELNSLSSLILRCSLLLRLAGLCILHRGIDTVEVWGSSPYEPTIHTGTLLGLRFFPNYDLLRNTRAVVDFVAGMNIDLNGCGRNALSSWKTR